MKISLRFKQPDLARKTRAIPREIDRRLTEIVAAATSRTKLNAKQFAPVDKAGLKNSIHSAADGLTGEVTVNVTYGPFLEFGTGSKVVVPGELKDYAMQFKGKGIRQVNNRAQPYLYPAFFINRERFKKACDKALKEVL